MWISKGVLNYFVWTLKIKRALLISRDFEEILSAPLEIQIFKIINIKRPLIWSQEVLLKDQLRVLRKVLDMLKQLIQT